MIFLHLSLLFTTIVCALAQSNWGRDEVISLPNSFHEDRYYSGIQEQPWEEISSFPEIPRVFPPYYETNDIFREGQNSVSLKINF